jgi:hypothetical protein
MKKGLLLMIACVFACATFAREIELKSGSTPEPGEPTNPRSIESEVTASIDDQVVTVSFSDLTTSQIIVTDSANQTVFNQTYSASYSVQADLLSIPLGNYTIYIYAYGYCWVGVFSIE